MTTHASAISDRSNGRGDRYRVGLLGLGHIAREHADAIAAIDALTIAAVCDVDPSRSASWASTLGCRGFTESGAFFESDIDVAVLLLPHHLHAPMAIQAMTAGLHVVVEKPMATSVDDCRRMIQIAEATDRLLLVADTAEHTPGALETGQRYRDGWLGAFLTGSMLTARRYFHSKRPDWFLDPARSGGGMFANVGIHRLAMARAAVSGLKPSEVSAATRPLPNHPVEACTTALVRYRDGTAMQHQEIGYIAAPTWLRTGTYLLFERGMVGWDADHWHFNPVDGDAVTQPLLKQQGYQPVYQQVLRLLRSGALAGHAYGSAQDVAIVVAAYQSAQHGRAVTVESLTAAAEKNFA